ncbi:histidine decarboxylase [Bradyrhizobium sp. SZCCHNRI1003]|uniref:histidine decarboxylase n=1 Tax=Bradyrhizobium sp. SZCCHNRI1003 TaxID=3057275 RepID=UPI002916E156|nr:histidine decarboxylase [Bradyrhizobium sp. SZCCHNRI1003]
MAVTSVAGVINEAPQPVDVRFARKLEEFRSARSNHLGYPYNLDFAAGASGQFAGFLVNNLGDPYAGSHYATETCDLEREVVDWFMRLWECQDPDQYWGSVGASGTEGNIWGLYLAREALPDGIVLYSQDAHYSIPKGARILRMDSRCVASRPNGELDLAAFATTVESLKGRPIIATLNCGTTVKGAHDDIEAVIDVLRRSGYDRARRFVHVDGALNAMVLPFDAAAPSNIKPSFEIEVDSVSASGHKMVGTPMPCGVIVTLKRHVNRVSSAVSYLRTNDTTLMGSRNGHAVLALWERINRHGRAGFTKDVVECLARARRLHEALVAEGVWSLLNPHSITVVFPEPSHALVKKYQLACHQYLAHAVVMPNVTDRLLDNFLSDYIRWWRLSDVRSAEHIIQEART